MLKRCLSERRGKTAFAAAVLSIFALLAFAAPVLAAPTAFKESIPGPPFTRPYGMSPDGAGNLFIADAGAGAIDKYDSSNTLTEAITNAGLNPSYTRSVAVNDTTGVVYVGESGSEEIFVFKPEVGGGYGLIQRVQPPNHNYLYLAVDNSLSPRSGDVYVIEGGGLLSVYETTAEGQLEIGSAITLTPPEAGFSLLSFSVIDGAGGLTVDARNGTVYLAEPGNHTVAVYDSAGARESLEFVGPTGFEPIGVAVDEVSGDLYAINAASKRVDIFSAAGAFEGELTVKDGSGPFNFTQPLGIAVQNAGPNRGKVYVSNGRATEAETDVFATLQPSAPTISETSVGAVSSDAADLFAEIKPSGEAATYRFQYGACATAQTCAAAPFDRSAPELEANIGVAGDFTHHEVTVHLQGLAPQTTYHFRAVATNVLGETIGEEAIFITQTPGPFALPDNRGWEMISPPDKHGALLLPLPENGAPQAAADGSAVTYLATAPTESGPPGNATHTQVLSARGASGAWQSRDISGPHSAATGLGNSFEYDSFSPDLSRGLLQPQGAFEPSLSPAATQQTPFLRTNFLLGEPDSLCTSSCYRPLLSACPEEGEPCPPTVEAAANVPPGTEFGEDVKCAAPESSEQENLCGPQFVGASPDLGHVIVASVAPLTPGAPEGIPGGTLTRQGVLYEWSADHSPSEQLQLLTIRPNGAPAPASTLPSIGTRVSSGPITRNAISSDGSRVVWSEGPPSLTSTGHLYLRYNATEPQSEVSAGQCTEPELACTLQLDLKTSGSGAGPVGPVFQTASTDGSVIFFTDTQRLTADSGAAEGEPDLYECKLLSGEEGELKCELTDLTPANGTEPAAVLGAVPGASEDGSSVYFVAQGVLTHAANPLGETASPGDCAYAASPATGICNLYLSHAGQTTFVAALSAADHHDWEEKLASNTSRTSPNGRWLAFMSNRPLTGYDNRDASSGESAQEVYLYDAAANEGKGKLICASCNPTGARPHGVEYGANGQIVSWSLSFEEPVAASVPGWMPVIVDVGAHYQPRYLSNEGRLFFNSSDALVPQDSNGTEDVYQYEPPQGEGTPGGDTCTESTSTYSPASQGCVDLISSGTSSGESAFLDASESGKDVFFLTQAQLSRRDEDTSRDFYDARSGGGEPQPVKPVECEGDGCQQPATPPNDATPGSLTFSGAGNLHESKAKSKKTHKSKKHRKKKSHKRPANKSRRASR
jgi:DNA-binding beta-propeller fold protein YncE